MNRRGFLKNTAYTTAGVALAGMRSGLTAAATPGRAPNIIFVYADDWGWGDLSSHGHPYIRTPNLDRLRAQGTDFSQFNVLSPVCSPSRTAVMTGHFPARYCIHQHFADVSQNRERGMPDWLDPQAVMLPRLLQQAGYATAHFGKWHLTNRDALDKAPGRVPPATAYGYGDYAGWNGPKPGIGHRDIYDRALSFLRAHQGRPVFINLWLHETHTPHRPSEASLADFAHLGEVERVYAAVVADGDKGIGRILAGVDELGLADDTLLVFSSDNGPEVTGRQERLGDGYGTRYSVGQTGGLRGRKRSLFEGGVRVPFLVRWPGRTPAGQTNDTTVVTAVDLLPTFCAAAGARLPDGYEPDGENLLPALQGRSVKRTKPIFWEWRGYAGDPDWWPRLAVRDGDWKLLLSADGNRLELYDLAGDRAEARDVAREHADVVQRLTGMARNWQRSLPQDPNPACMCD